MTSNMKDVNLSRQFSNVAELEDQERIRLRPSQPSDRSPSQHHPSIPKCIDNPLVPYDPPPTFSLLIDSLLSWFDSRKEELNDGFHLRLLRHPSPRVAHRRHLAGRRKVDGSSYLGLPLPFNMTTLIWIEVRLIGYIEFQRNTELDPEKRLYPGGPYFDPLGLAADPAKKATLQLAEIKHARLAMIGFLGFAMQAAATGKGPLNYRVTHLSEHKS